MFLDSELSTICEDEQGVKEIRTHSHFFLSPRPSKGSDVDGEQRGMRKGEEGVTDKTRSHLRGIMKT